MKTQELQLGVAAFLHRRGLKFGTEHRKSIKWRHHRYVHIFVNYWQNFKNFSLAYSAGNVQHNYKQIIHQMYMQQYCEAWRCKHCIYKRVAECNRIIRRTGVLNWEFAGQAVSEKLLCRWSTRLVGQKKPQWKTWGNQPKWENPRWPPLAQ